MASEHPEAQWFAEARFGVFVHWGPYSLREIEASWPLMAHSRQHLPVSEYESLALQFSPDRYDPRQWAQTAKEAGARYIVLTAKHHDGYCLFDTTTTDYCAPRTGPGRDLIEPYVVAAREVGLKVGLYFTTIDWHDPDFATIPIASRIQSPKPFEYDPLRWYAFHRRFVEQLRELLTNYGRIDLIWFDVPGFGADRWRSHEVKTMMRNLQPHIVINDRLPDAGDYTTPEQYIPTRPPAGWWETCMTMNHQWAYHSDSSTYKSTGTLVRSLAEIASKGGNLLLNVGPRADGVFPQEAIDRYRQIGQWLSHSGEAIYATRRSPDPALFYGPVTWKDSSLYLHVLDIPRAPVRLRGVRGQITAVRLLRTGEEMEYRVLHGAGSRAARDALVEIDLSSEQCDPWDTVIAVDYAGPPVFPD